jgi:hypothetical protein
MNTNSLALEPSDDRAELLDGIAELVRERAQLQLRLRERLVQLWEDQTPFRLRRFVADELAVVLAESSLTTQRWIDDALMLEDHPEGSRSSDPAPGPTGTPTPSWTSWPDGSPATCGSR